MAVSFQAAEAIVILNGSAGSGCDAEFAGKLADKFQAQGLSVHVTLEFSNTTPLPAKIYANEGVAQVLFFESDEVCETSYKDRGGKYQGQKGVTLPKM